MPTDKEIEWAQKEISINNTDCHDLPAKIMRDAYLSMKAERDKYKAIVEADAKALIEFTQWAEREARWDKCGQSYYDAKKALALRENKEE